MAFGAGIRRATYLCLDCAKNVDKNWNITVSSIIHVNFDHAWAEHYPVTLNGSQYTFYYTTAVYLLVTGDFDVIPYDMWFSKR